MSAETDLDDFFEKLLQEVQASLEKKKLRRERPWTYDIIRILWPCKSGLHMDNLERELWTLRNRTLPMPKEFRKTVQSTLNHHTSQSKVFKNKRRSVDDDLFYSPRGKGSGTWAVHHDRVIAWLEKKRLRPA